MLTVQLSPLGEAVASGSHECVQELIDVGRADVGRPSLVTVACAAGHLDALRAVLPLCDAASVNEAYSVAFVLGRKPVLRSLLRHGNWCWTEFIVRLLEVLPKEVTRRVCERVGLTEAATAECCRWDFDSLLWAVRGALVGKRITREVAEAALRQISSVKCESRLWGRLEDWKVTIMKFELEPVRTELLTLGVRIECCAPEDVNECMLAQLRILLSTNPDALAAELWTVKTRVLWVIWLDAGVPPLPWSRYADGREFCPVLIQAWSEAEEDLLRRVVRSLAAKGVLARHHFCGGPDGCACGYLRPVPWVMRVLIGEGATACRGMVTIDGASGSTATVNRLEANGTVRVAATWKH